MKRLLFKIPAPFRAALYSLPLFINWIVGLTWEEDKIALRAARRSMILALAFLAACGLLYLASSLVAAIFPASHYRVDYGAFIVHALICAVYLPFVLVLTFMEIRSRPLEIKGLDRFAEKFERLAGF